ncbi:MAG: PIN domain-containing protein [Candidatus Aminicenantes bacterium]|nr:MAG: PIN domain-containing protein [Candidatus Aminicenantes bacterium]
MKKVTIDLNVLLDFLNKREDHRQAALIVDLCVKKRVKGYICAHEFTTLSYFLHKERGNIQRVRYALTSLLDIFTTIPVTEKILRDSLDSPINDFEDAVVEVSSMKKKVEYIITRDMSDFNSSRVKALTPSQFLQRFHKDEFEALAERNNKESNSAPVT